jgi:hypothetical protein
VARIYLDVDLWQPSRITSRGRRASLVVDNAHDTILPDAGS